jgi:hypothetical protein
MVRFVWQHSYEESVCVKGINSKTPAIISKVHYLHFSVILFSITLIVSYVVSIMTKPIAEENVIKFFELIIIKL